MNLELWAGFECSNGNHLVASYNVHKVMYSVRHNVNIYSIIHSSATCFSSSEPSSGQYFIYGHGVCSECIYYGIQYSLETSLSKNS